MTPTERTEQLLEKILEVQKSHLEEYKRVTTESLKLQRQAVDTQARHTRTYVRFIVLASILILLLGAYVVWLSRHL